MFLNAPHTFELNLHPVPITLHTLSMDTCYWIYKIQTVVHDPVLCNIRQCTNSCLVSGVIIRMDDCSQRYMSLYNGNQSYPLSVGNNSHQSQWRCLRCIDHPNTQICDDGGRPRWCLGLCRKQDSSISTILPGPPSIGGSSRIKRSEHTSRHW